MQDFARDVIIQLKLKDGGESIVVVIRETKLCTRGA
jgi:hypothetical protein